MKNKINKIVIEGIFGIERHEYVFDGANLFNAVMGNCGSGKSSLIKAIEIIKGLTLERGYLTTLESSSVVTDSKDGLIRFLIEFNTTNSLKYSLEYVLMKREGRLTFIKEELNFWYDVKSICNVFTILNEKFYSSNISMILEGVRYLGFISMFNDEDIRLKSHIDTALDFIRHIIILDDFKPLPCDERVKKNIIGISALIKCINPRIDGIDLKTNEDGITHYIIRYNRRRVNMCNESVGVKRLINIIFTLVNYEDIVLVIDDIDLGMNDCVLKGLFQILRRFGVEIIFTANNFSFISQNSNLNTIYVLTNNSAVRIEKDNDPIEICKNDIKYSIIDNLVGGLYEVQAMSK